MENGYTLLNLSATMDTALNSLDAPQIIAMRQYHVDVVHTLVEQGANSKYACKSKRSSLFVIESLHLRGPGMTPPNISLGHLGNARRPDRAMLDLLLEHRADLSPKDDEVNQILHNLCNSQSSVNIDLRNSARDERLVLTLLNRGIDVNAANHNCEYTLYLATVNCNV